MVKHTSTYQIPLDPLFLRKKKSCDPLFHLALFHFRRSLDRRGSRWERCCECFKTVCNHLSKINRRSTRIKSKFLQVGWLGVVGKGLYYLRFVDVLNKNMTTFLPNPLSSICLSFGKRRQAWPRSSKCHRLTCYSFVRSSFVWKSFRKRSATLQSFPVDTIQADQIANTSFAQCESNNKSNNTHHFSIQSFIEIPSYHPWEPGSSHTELTSFEISLKLLELES